MNAKADKDGNARPRPMPKPGTPCPCCGARLAVRDYGNENEVEGLPHCPECAFVCAPWTLANNPDADESFRSSLVKYIADHTAAEVQALMDDSVMLCKTCGEVPEADFRASCIRDSELTKFLTQWVSEGRRVAAEYGKRYGMRLSIAACPSRADWEQWKQRGLENYLICTDDNCPLPDRLAARNLPLLVDELAQTKAATPAKAPPSRRQITANKKNAKQPRKGRLEVDQYAIAIADVRRRVDALGTDYGLLNLCKRVCEKPPEGLPKPLPIGAAQLRNRYKKQYPKRYRRVCK